MITYKYQRNCKYFWILFVFLNQTLCDNENDKECTGLEVSLFQKIENEGFHRDIQWLIEIESTNALLWNNSNCQIALRMDLVPGLFVNPDQIADLQRVNQIAAVIEGKVNVETPMHESNSNIIYLYQINDNKKELSFHLPIHLRYQRAQITGGYGKVTLQKPTILIRCPPKSITLCDRKLRVSAPCSSVANITCVWRNITYKMLSENTDMLVPIGDLDHYPLVSVVTLLIGCAGCIYVLSVLSTTRI